MRITRQNSWRNGHPYFLCWNISVHHVIFMLAWFFWCLHWIIYWLILRYKIVFHLLSINFASLWWTDHDLVAEKTHAFKSIYFAFLRHICLLSWQIFGFLLKYSPSIHLVLNIEFQFPKCLTKVTLIAPRTYLRWFLFVILQFPCKLSKNTL